MKRIFAVAGFVLVSGCQTLSASQQGAQAHAMVEAKSGSTVAGHVDFRDVSDGVLITAKITGLKPNAEHGFHVHEKGDCAAADATSAGGHFNPDNAAHGHYQQDKRHAGDLPNLVADSKGEATTSFKVSPLRLIDGKYQIVNRAIVIHANADDYQSQPAGNAGGRIGCGAIAKVS